MTWNHETLYLSALVHPRASLVRDIKEVYFTIQLSSDQNVGPETSKSVWLRNQVNMISSDLDLFQTLKNHLSLTIQFLFPFPYIYFSWFLSFQDLKSLCSLLLLFLCLSSEDETKIPNSANTWFFSPIFLNCCMWALIILVEVK